MSKICNNGTIVLIKLAQEGQMRCKDLEREDANMILNTSVSHTSADITKVAARIAVVLAAAFLIILFLLHFLESDFDPSRVLISEYETGQFGLMMRLAFFCWGGSVMALVVAMWHSLHNLVG